MTVRQAIGRALGLLNRRDRRLLGLSVVIQMSTSLLDLVGVLLVGMVGALAVTTVQSQPPPAPISALAHFLGLGDLSEQSLVIVLAAAAALVFLTKSILSSYLTRRVFIFLANRQAMVSARLTRELLARPLTFVLKRSSQETAYALISGVSYATSQVLGQFVVACTEIALLMVLGVALLVVSPWTAIGAIIFFALIALSLQAIVGGRAARLGEVAVGADIASLNAIQEALSSYREITVSHRRELYVDRIQDLRWRAAKVSAELQFIGIFPKYIFESALVVGGFALAGVLFATQNSVAAVGTLALFLAAGSRVMPSILRLQGATLTLRGASGGAATAFELAADLGNPVTDTGSRPDPETIRHAIQQGHPGLSPSLGLSRVSFTYPGGDRPALQEVSLTAGAGQSVALVGRSGAGKSTLADIILGVLEPSEGSAHLGGKSPTDSVRLWPGGIAYVPQQVALANDTIRANVALGLPRAAIDDDMVWEALTRAHLADYVRSTDAELDSEIGERGVRLSGGQRQRLGIARALYTRPRLLVLDEATSALDAETERDISQMLDELEGDVTTVIIAHRLSTVQHVDLMLYLEEGRVVASGTFRELLDLVPALKRQADLMGLVKGET